MLDRFTETETIIQAAIEVHKTLGCGFIEQVYQKALAVEFELRNIPFEREKHLTIEYKQVVLKKDFFVDFVCFGDIIVELKATNEIKPEFIQQTLNYMKAANAHIGLILNFGQLTLNIKRLAR